MENFKASCAKMLKFKLVLTLSVLTVWPCIVQAQKIDKATFLELHKTLEPQNQAWQTIPWETDLLIAQQLAAASQKPIFIWAMDGHPLGCT